MNMHRRTAHAVTTRTAGRTTRAALAVTTCAVGLSLSACSAGIITTHPAASHSPAAPSHSAAATPRSPSASRSPSPSPKPSPSPSADRTIRVNSSVRVFPIPRGADVEYNGSCRKQVMVMLSPITPAKSIAFYTTALPRAGYKITGNLSSGSGDSAMKEIEFTGHGYSGSIAAFTDLGKAIDSASGSPAPDPAGSGFFNSMTKNVTEISMSLPGVPDTYMCPGT